MQCHIEVKMGWVREDKTQKTSAMVTNLGICYSPKYEVYRNGNLLPFHRSGLQGHMQQDCNLHTRNPVNEQIMSKSENVFIRIKFKRVNNCIC